MQTPDVHAIKGFLSRVIPRGPMEEQEIIRLMDMLVDSHSVDLGTTYDYSPGRPTK